MSVYHVASDGSDSNDGGESDPLRTFEPLAENGNIGLSDGDEVVIHGTVPISNGETLTMWHADGVTIRGADGGAEIDCTNYDGTVEERPVLWIGQSENITIRDLEIHHAPGHPIAFEKTATGASLPFGSINDMKVGGHVVDCSFHHNGLPLMWGEGRGGVAERVESYANFGPSDPDLGSNFGGDADGIQFTSGPNDAEAHHGGAVIDCSMHHNSDDGLDLYRATAVIIKNSVAYANGYNLDGEKVGEAPGKGFKLGGGDEDFDSGGCLIYNCAAWMNGAPGIGFNGSNLPNDIWNCTLFGNARVRGGDKDIEMYTRDGPSGNHVDKSTVYNTIAELGVWTHETDLDTDRVEHNNFDAQGDVQRNFEDVDFRSVSVDDTGNPTDWERFLKLTSDSPVIGAGKPTPTETPADRYHNGAVELEYDGDAPDLGAYQFESTSSEPEPDPKPEFSLDSDIVVDEAFMTVDSDATPTVVVGFRNVSQSVQTLDVPITVDGEAVENRSVSLGTLTNGRFDRAESVDHPMTGAVRYSLESASDPRNVHVGPVSFSIDSDGNAVVRS